jgi:hypothetical protein
VVFGTKIVKSRPKLKLLLSCVFVQPYCTIEEQLGLNGYCEDSEALVVSPEGKN